MGINIQDIESEDFDKWIESIHEDGKNAVIEVTEELAKITKEESEKELQKLQRTTKLPKGRKKHMYQDVIITRSKRYKKVEVGGGRETGSLWHIVNDGTYRTKATHFMSNIINRIESVAEAAWEKAGRKL